MNCVRRHSRIPPGVQQALDEADSKDLDSPPSLDRMCMDRLASLPECNRHVSMR